MTDSHLTPVALYARVSSDRQDVDLSVLVVPPTNLCYIGTQLAGVVAS